MFSKHFSSLLLFTALNEKKLAVRHMKQLNISFALLTDTVKNLYESAISEHPETLRMLNGKRQVETPMSSAN